MLKARWRLAGAGTTCLLMGGMAAGAAIGHYLPAGGQRLGEEMDATLLRSRQASIKRAPASGALT